MLFTTNKLDGVCRVTICTIQRLYAMLRDFLFWIETLTPQEQITRGHRLRVVRVQRRVRNASTTLLSI